MTPSEFTSALDKMHLVGDHYEMTFQEAASIVAELAADSIAAHADIPAKHVASVERRVRAVA